jgi:hypothetical protein
MLTIRRSQLAMLGAAMLQRFIDDETQRVATALGLRGIWLSPINARGTWSSRTPVGIDIMVVEHGTEPASAIRTR